MRSVLIQGLERGTLRTTLRTLKNCCGSCCEKCSSFLARVAGVDGIIRRVEESAPGIILNINNYSWFRALWPLWPHGLAALATLMDPVHLPHHPRVLYPPVHPPLPYPPRVHTTPGTTHPPGRLHRRRRATHGKRP